MKFRTGDKVMIKYQERKFYETSFGLTVYTGTITNSNRNIITNSNRNITFVLFDNNKKFPVFTVDLNPTKNYQFLFNFMD